MEFETYLFWGVIVGVSALGILMLINLFWVKYYVRTGEVCDGILPLCTFENRNFCWNPDSSDLVIYTFFRTFFGTLMSIAIGFTWPVSVWFFGFLFLSWFREELPKAYTFHRKNGRW